MPYYDFVCKKCNKSIELLMPIKRFEKFEKKGLPCNIDKNKCDGIALPVLGAAAFVPRINLRLSAKQRRKLG